MGTREKCLEPSMIEGKIKVYIRQMQGMIYTGYQDLGVEKKVIELVARSNQCAELLGANQFAKEISQAAKGVMSKPPEQEEVTTFATDLMNPDAPDAEETVAPKAAL